MENSDIPGLVYRHQVAHSIQLISFPQRHIEYREPKWVRHASGITRLQPRIPRSPGAKWKCRIDGGSFQANPPRCPLRVRGAGSLHGYKLEIRWDCLVSAVATRSSPQCLARELSRLLLMMVKIVEVIVETGRHVRMQKVKCIWKTSKPPSVRN